jgi:hypothetical protein
MMRFALILMVTMVISGGASANPPAYAEGQIWQYHSRPGEDGSLIKIAKIEKDPARFAGRAVYHISIIGVRMGPAGGSTEIAHLPVSVETLDKSVTNLVQANLAFPDVEPGIAEWRRAKGGVFTIPLAEIVTVVGEAIARAPSPEAGAGTD